MWELDYKESWAPKNWCFWTVVLEKTLESPLDWREIKPVHPKGNQSWIFIGRTNVEAETPILWLPDVKNWLIWKDPGVGKDWRQEKKGMMEDEMTISLTWWTGIWESSGRADGREASHAAVRGVAESDMTEQLNCTEATGKKKKVATKRSSFIQKYVWEILKYFLFFYNMPNLKIYT